MLKSTQTLRQIEVQKIPYELQIRMCWLKLTQMLMSTLTQRLACEKQILMHFLKQTLNSRLILIRLLTLKLMQNSKQTLNYLLIQTH